MYFQGREANAFSIMVTRNKEISMRKGIAIALFAVVLAASAGAAGLETKSLTVRGGDPVAYQCSKQERIVARYFSLSDDSLSFVKVSMPDGREHTLPNALSASGARYTDDRTVVWWTKGNTAFAQERDQNGEWQTKYSDCTEKVGR